MTDDQATFPARDLRGRSLTEAVVGWHVLGDSRTAVLLFLHVADLGWLEAHTAGDGSLQLRPRDPENFEMEEYGRFEMLPAEDAHPLAALVGQRITAIQYFAWRGATFGIQLRAGDKAAVVANNADEIFVSTGDLPRVYASESVILED